MNLLNLFPIQLPGSEGGARFLLLTPPTEDSEVGLVIGTTMNSLLSVSLNQTSSPLDGVKIEGVPITQVELPLLEIVCGLKLQKKKMIITFVRLKLKKNPEDSLVFLKNMSYFHFHSAIFCGYTLPLNYGKHNKKVS